MIDKLKSLFSNEKITKQSEVITTSETEIKETLVLEQTQVEQPEQRQAEAVQTAEVTTAEPLQPVMPVVRTYLISYVETIFYKPTKIKAESEDEAKEKFLKRLEDGTIKIDDLKHDEHIEELWLWTI